MAEQIPIAVKGDYRREILLLVVLGFGALAYSFGTMAMYAEPDAKPLEITLRARPQTEPRSLATGSSGGDSQAPAPPPAATPPAANPVETPAAKPPVAATPVPAPAALAPAAPAPAAAKPTAPTPAVAVPAPTPPAAAPVPVKPAAEVPPAMERVRITHQRMNGELVEVHDFTRGIEYRGEVHDFRAGQPPRWIREREGGSQR